MQSTIAAPIPDDAPDVTRAVFRSWPCNFGIAAVVGCLTMPWGLVPVGEYDIDLWAVIAIGVGAASVGVVLVIRALRRTIVITRQSITVRGVFITYEAPWSSHPRLMFSDAETNGGVLVLETGPGRVVRRRVGTTAQSELFAEAERFADVLDVVAPKSVAVVGSRSLSDVPLTVIAFVSAAVAILLGLGACAASLRDLRALENERTVSASVEAVGTNGESGITYVTVEFPTDHGPISSVLTVDGGDFIATGTTVTIVYDERDPTRAHRYVSPDPSADPHQEAVEGVQIGLVLLGGGLVALVVVQGRRLRTRRSRAASNTDLDSGEEM